MAQFCSASDSQQFHAAIFGPDLPSGLRLPALTSEDSPRGERESSSAGRRIQRRRNTRESALAPPSPRGEGQGEGEFPPQSADESSGARNPREPALASPSPWGEGRVRGNFHSDQPRQERDAPIPTPNRDFLGCLLLST
jgi:hypothetical protein